MSHYVFQHELGSALIDGLSREHAYTVCSLAADLRVTQVANGSKGIRVALEKPHLAR